MSTNPSPVCPRCGAALAAGSVDGLCANCLGALNFAASTAFSGENAAAAAAPLPVEELAPHFPQLEILECLGRGGMGVVYKARQKSLNRLVALKLLAPERAAHPGFAERFAREAQALAALSHPNIVGVHDFGQAGGFYFLLMEFVDGVNLRQAMNAKRFSPEQALAVVPPICEALQYAHEHGIIHRDIKPENLLLDKEGRVKIADFGIAKMLGDESTAGLADSQPAGTPQYMAPEQKDHQRSDHRADIYSLGVVLYEMLTGERPKEKIEAPSKRVQVDVRIDEIVLRALEKTPELRYQTAAEMRTQVETLSERAPAQPPEPAPAPVSASISLLVFAAVFAIYLGYLTSTFGELPARPAVHFGFGGQPDRWMSRSGYVVWSAIFPLFFVGLFWLVSRFTKWCPALVNIPRKDYWLAPERSAQTASFLFHRLLWLASIETIFFGALHGLVLAANRQTPPHLPLEALTLWIIAFFLVILIWIVALIARFAEAEHGRGLTGSQRDHNSITAGPPTPATARQRFFHAIGYRHIWSQRLLVVTLLGFLGFLGSIPGWEPWLNLLWFFAFVLAASLVERLASRSDPASQAASSYWRRQWFAALLVIAIAIPARIFLFGQYVVSGNSAAPEIPAASRILVWKIARSYAPGEMVAYRQDDHAYVGRVVRATAEAITVNRNSRPDEAVPRSLVVGKVISVYWRGAEAAAPAVTSGNANAGIGIALALKDGHLLIGSLVPNAPASEDGRLRPGDEIISYGESKDAMKSAAGHSLDESVTAMRGEPGSPITLRVIPAGKTATEAYDLTLTRQLIPVLEAGRLGQLGTPAPRAPASTPAPREVVLKKFGPDDPLISTDVQWEKGPDGAPDLILDRGEYAHMAEAMQELLRDHDRNDPEVVALRNRMASYTRALGKKTFRLYEIANPNVEDCTLIYRAKLKTDRLQGGAHLEMWCRLPATGESGAIEINHLEGTNNWASCQITHVLQKGERPDLIRLNVVIEGEGDVRAKDIEWCTIANPPPPAASAEPASAASTENPNPPTPPRQPAPDPNDASELSQEGWRLWQAGQFQAAIVKFKGATNLAPNDANSWNGLGWASFNSGKIAEAEKAFQKVISLQPNHAGALNGLGQIYLAQRKYETAEPFLLKAAQQPGASAAWFGLARLYLLEGKYDDAGKWAQMLVDSGQGDALATKMLEAAKEKQLRDGLRQTIEPPVPAKSEGDTSQPPKVP